jgi:SAM-dependent methyltransferase
MTDALYDSFIADYYDESPIVQTRLSDVAFYRDAAWTFGGPVLELGCGTGRITLALAEAGHRITGLDLSQRMLRQAERRRAALPPDLRGRVKLVHADMCQFDLGEQFPLVIIPFRGFQHLLEVEEQLDCLECVKKHLSPGGKLILDLFQTDAERMHDRRFMEESSLVEYRTADGRNVRISERVTAYHRARQRNDVEMIFSVTNPHGKTERLVFAWTLRYFFCYEVEHLLSRAGFLVEALHGDFDRSPLRDSSPEMIFTANLG